MAADHSELLTSQDCIRRSDSDPQIKGYGGGRWVWLPWAESSPTSTNCTCREQSHDHPNPFQSIPVSISGSILSHGQSRNKTKHVDEPTSTDDIEEQSSLLHQQLSELSTFVRPLPPPEDYYYYSPLLDKAYLWPFTAAFAANTVCLYLAVAGRFLGDAKARAVDFCIGNLLSLALCRSRTFTAVASWLVVGVLGVSADASSADSFLRSLGGGVHSSCGIFSLVWLSYSLALPPPPPPPPPRSSNAPTEITLAASAVLSLLFLACATAFSYVRRRPRHTTTTSSSHRIAGRLALLFLWVFVVLTAGYDGRTSTYANLSGANLAKQHEVWITLAITLFANPFTVRGGVPVSDTTGFGGTMTAGGDPAAAGTGSGGRASFLKFTGGGHSGVRGTLPSSEWHAVGHCSFDISI